MHDRAFYSPTLRLKEGEVVALANLAPIVRSYICPVFVAAPPADRDPEKRRPLTAEELIVENGRRVARAWGNGSCMLDVRFLIDKLGIEAAASWIPGVFKASVEVGARPGVVVSLADARGPMLLGSERAMERHGLFAAIRLTLSDLQETDLEERLGAVLRFVDRTPQESVAIVDFGDADVGVAAIAADVLLAAYERLAVFGRWKKIILSTTSYPEKNPAKENDLILVPRTETAIWERIFESRSVDAGVAVMGDFGPDSAKFKFAGGSFLPIPHYRYSTITHWLVVRGKKDAKQASNVISIARRLVADKNYLGPDFSFGDRYIWDSSNGRVVGGPKEWRAANVNHHLQLTTKQLGTRYGVQVPALATRPEQVSLLSILDNQSDS